MINFVICDDHKEIVKSVCNAIDKVMMKNNLAYKKHTFNDYNKRFLDLIETDLTSRIYILDIEVPSASGIDIARKIRKTDINSIIIFLTSHNELGSVLLQDEIMFLTFICKFNNMEERLSSALNKAIDMLGNKQAVRFEDHNILYTIPLNSILYISKDTINRKTIIVTENNTFNVNKNMYEIVELLDSRFKQAHRSCFINMDKVIKIDKKNNEVLFSNNSKTNLLSDSFKKEF